MPGPARPTLITTAGISATTAWPNSFWISAMPGPAEAVTLFTPVTEAPMTAFSEANSSSIWI